jgi:hypothetical protein
VWYFITFIDDATRKVWAYPTRTKDRVLTIFKDWLAMVENQTNQKLKCLRSDNGREYKSDEFVQFCWERVSDTKDRGLLYRAGTIVQLAGYTDADWAGNATNRRSTSGYAFSIGSAAIAWSRKKQPTVALSSTEAEYRGAAVATCEAV